MKRLKPIFLAGVVATMTFIPSYASTPFDLFDVNSNIYKAPPTRVYLYAPSTYVKDVVVHTRSQNKNGTDTYVSLVEIVLQPEFKDFEGIKLEHVTDKATKKIEVENVNGVVSGTIGPITDANLFGDIVIYVSSEPNPIMTLKLDLQREKVSYATDATFKDLFPKPLDVNNPYVFSEMLKDKTLFGGFLSMPGTRKYQVAQDLSQVKFDMSRKALVVPEAQKGNLTLEYSFNATSANNGYWTEYKESDALSLGVMTSFFIREKGLSPNIRRINVARQDEAPKIGIDFTSKKFTNIDSENYQYLLLNADEVPTNEVQYSEAFINSESRVKISDIDKVTVEPGQVYLIRYINNEVPTNTQRLQVPNQKTTNFNITFDMRNASTQQAIPSNISYKIGEGDEKSGENQVLKFSKETFGKKITFWETAKNDAFSTVPKEVTIPESVTGEELSTLLDNNIDFMLEQTKKSLSQQVEYFYGESVPSGSIAYRQGAVNQKLKVDSSNDYTENTKLWVRYASDGKRFAGEWVGLTLPKRADSIKNDMLDLSNLYAQGKLMLKGDENISVQYSKDPRFVNGVGRYKDFIALEPKDVVYLRVAPKEESKAAAGSYASQTFKIEVPARPEKPMINIDYINEVITQSTTDIGDLKWSYNAEMFSDQSYGTDHVNSPFEIGKLNIPEPGKMPITLYFKLSNTEKYFDSDITKVVVPARPEAPKVSELKFLSHTNGRNLYELVNMNTRLEYTLLDKKDATKEDLAASVWKTPSSSTVILEASDDKELYVYVRTKATINSFGSESVYVALPKNTAKE